MKLLDPEKITAEKKKGEQEIAERIKKLNEEERASVDRLNKALAKESDEKKRIDNEDLTLARYESETAAKKSVLLREIKVLEERKSQALEPIHAQEKEAQDLLSKAKKTNAIADQRREDAAGLCDAYEEKLDSLVDRESAAVETDRKQNKREAGIQAAESEITRSTKELGEKWTAFHKAVHDQNTDMERHEKEVENGKKTNEDIRAEIEKERQRIQEEDRAVRDKYKALEQAKIHLGIK